MSKTIVILLASFLFSSVAQASLDMCLKNLRGIKASRAIKTKNSSTGISSHYIPSKGMIVSTYSDSSRPSGHRIVAHQKGGSVELTEDRVSCQSSQSEDIYSEISAIIDHNMSSDYHKFGNDKKKSNYPSEGKIRSIIKNCNKVDNPKVKAAVNRLIKHKGYTDLLPAASSGGGSSPSGR